MLEWKRLFKVRTQLRALWESLPGCETCDWREKRILMASFESLRPALQLDFSDLWASTFPFVSTSLVVPCGHGSVVERRPMNLEVVVWFQVRSEHMVGGSTPNRGHAEGNQSVSDSPSSRMFPSHLPLWKKNKTKHTNTKTSFGCMLVNYHTPLVSKVTAWLYLLQHSTYALKENTVDQLVEEKAAQTSFIDECTHDQP